MFIAQAISYNLGSKKVKYISKEEALLCKDIDVSNYSLIFCIVWFYLLHVKINCWETLISTEIA